MDASSRLPLTQSLTPYHINDDCETKKEIFSNNHPIPNKMRLLELKIQPTEYKAIVDFVDKLGPVKVYTVIKKKHSGLAFSIACIPKADQVSIYILLKKHRIKQIAEGTFSSITSVYDVDSQRELIFKSAAKKFISETEIEINKALAGRQEFVATDKIFEYEGPVRERIPHERLRGNVNNQTNIPLSKSYDPNKAIKHVSIQHEIREDVSKVGFLLEHLDMSLGAYIYSENELSLKTYLLIVREMLQNIDVLHTEFGIVHLDIKEDNILVYLDPLTKKIVTKIADFGHSLRIGNPIRNVASAYYKPPEFIDFSKNIHLADTSSDMWSFGALLVHAFQNQNITKLWEEMVEDMHRSQFKNDDTRECLVSRFISRLTKIIIIEKPKMLPILQLIKSCLKIDPTKRIKAIEGVRILDDLFKQLSLI